MANFVNKLKAWFDNTNPRAIKQKWEESEKYDKIESMTVDEYFEYLKQINERKRKFDNIQDI